MAPNGGASSVQSRTETPAWLPTRAGVDSRRSGWRRCRPEDEKIETALIDPGRPWQNGANESFNGKFRDECLGMQWFQNRTEARVVIEAWRREFNTVRPHSSLGHLTPAEFAERRQSTQQTAAIF